MPLVHIDTGHNFPETIQFRDDLVQELGVQLIVGSVQDLIDKGFYTEVEARNASVGHIVTRALGTKAEVDVDTIEQEIEPNDLFLLCSDGLSDMVADWSIEETLAERDQNLDRKAKKLVTLANRNGGKDNISVILMQVQRTESNAAT